MTLYDEYQQRLEAANRSTQDLTQFEDQVDKSKPGWEFQVMDIAGAKQEALHAEINAWYRAEKARRGE